MDKRLFMHRVYKLFGRTHYYESEYGIKGYNRPAFHIECETESITVDPGEVRLSFDGLKDEYTLLDKKIEESPHLELMRLLENGEDPSKCSYVQRELKGCLDGRYEIPLPDHKKSYLKAKAELESGNYKRPMIYQLEGKWYVMDGKHRLAMNVLLGKNCECSVIPMEELKKDRYMLQLYDKMKQKNSYGRNIKHIESILNN